MKRRAWLCVGAALLVLPALGGPPQDTVAGRWRLVEQTYGEGRSSPASGTPDLRLELTPTGGLVGGRVWLAGREARGAPWPALFHEDEPRPVKVIAQVASEEGDRLLVTYEAADPEDASNILELTEDYSLAEGGRALVGTVTVRLRREGADAGGYQLRRRFERER